MVCPGRLQANTEASSKLTTLANSHWLYLKGEREESLDSAIQTRLHQLLFQFCQNPCPFLVPFQECLCEARLLKRRKRGCQRRKERVIPQPSERVPPRRCPLIWGVDVDAGASPILVSHLLHDEGRTCSKLPQPCSEEVATAVKGVHWEACWV